MVLRKQPPPRLDHSNKWYGRFEPRSQPSPTAQSTSSTSPKRLVRPRRAQSSPQPRRIPSIDTIYSPDLNTSPAFDLMTLEQAQRSPVAASSETPNPWTDELVERPGQGHHRYYSDSQGDSVNGKPESRVPPVLVAGTQHRMATNDWQSSAGVDEASEWEHLGTSQTPLQSNNPFLKPRQPEQNPWGNNQLHPSHGSEGYGSRSASLTRDNASDRISQNEGYIPMTARLSLLDEPAPESPWAEEGPNSNKQLPELPRDQQFGHEQWQSQASASDQVPLKIYLAQDQSYDHNRDPGVSAAFEESQPPLHDAQYNYPPQYTQHYTDHERLSPGNGINTPSATTSSATTQSSHELIEFDGSPRPEMDRATSSIYESDSNGIRYGSQGPLNAPGTVPPLPQRTDPTLAAGDSTEQRSSQPTASIVNSEIDANRINDQRSEPYSIRHINWTDITGKLRESPVLVQNKNGPCPLLALVNALVLRAGQDTHPPIVKALQTREQISLGLLIEAMFDELTSCLGPDDHFPDIEALSQFLTMLHTGMNVNPRLTLESENALGSFFQTSDIRLYGTFGVPLVHGWVAAPSTEAHSALARVAQYHEDIQLLHFRKEELEDRVFRGGLLSPEEEQTMHDIQLIQQFVDIENATQLSTFGLNHLTNKLAPGSISILFRNDHFSTVYKHPQLHKLYTLVTDAGYSSHAEVVWESLVDVNGSDAEFSAGDFRPVGHSAPEASGPAGPRVSSNRQSHSTASEGQRNTTLSPQEQADADYAYALSLQFQEEERENNGNNGNNANNGNNRPRNRPASTPHFPTGAQGLRTSHNRSSSVINSGNYGRRASGPDEGPPPSYEQASNSPAYLSPRPSTLGSSRDNRYSRNNIPRRPLPSSTTAGVSDRSSKDRRDKDCVVM